MFLGGALKISTGTRGILGVGVLVIEGMKSSVLVSENSGVGIEVLSRGWGVSVRKLSVEREMVAGIELVRGV